MIVTVFDLDDTLYPELDYAVSGLQVVGDHVDRVTGSKGAGQLFVKLLEGGARHKIFNLGLEQLGVSLEVASLVQIYRNHTPVIGLSDASQQALRHARALGGTAIITDGYASTQWAKIRALGLEVLVDRIVVTDDLGREAWKPSLRPFSLVEAALGQGRYCYIGDNPEKDFQAPRQLGWKTIRTSVPNPMYQRDLVCEAEEVVAGLDAVWEHWPG